MNILFICTGNISRSFLAEMLLKQALQESKIKHIAVQSAGLSALAGHGPDPHMVGYLEEHEVPFEKHEAHPVTDALLQWADLVLVMEAGHAAMINDLHPEWHHKIRLLSQYLPGNPAQDDICDPFGRSSYHYRLCQSQIALAIKALCAVLAKGKI